jgi:hypothetical protein
MFRPTSPSPIDPEHFGVGSVIKGSKEEYVVFAYNAQYVGLIDMSTYMQVPGEAVAVEDINYMTESETRELVRNQLPWTFSDYEFNAGGRK